MGNALEVVTQVRSQTGKKNLLNAGATDLSTDAYWHLNAATRFLSRFTPSVGKDQIYKVTLASGARGVNAPNLRFINNVSIEDGTEGETYLEATDYHKLRKLYYAGPTIESARPLYFARNIRQFDATGGGLTNGDFSLGLNGWTTQAGSPSVAGGILTLGATGVNKSDLSVDWVVGLPDVSIVSGNAHMKALLGDVSTMFKDLNVSSSEFSLNISTLPANSTVAVYTLLNFSIVDTNTYTTSGVKTITPSGDYDRITIQFSTSEATEQTAIINDISLFSQVVDVLYQRLPVNADAGDALNVVIDNITGGATLTVRVGTWNTSYDDITLVDSETYTTIGTKTFTPSGDWDVISIAISAVDAAIATIDSVTLESALPAADTGADFDILVGPQADQAYTCRVYGGYYPNRITLPTQMTWWMDKEEECVVDAMRLSLEGRLHRNQEGEDQELSRLLMQVRQIQSDLHWEEAFGSNQDLRLGI